MARQAEADEQSLFASPVCHTQYLQHGFFGVSLQCDFCFVISIVGGRTLRRENISIERLKNFALVFVTYIFSSQIYFSCYFMLENSSFHPDFSISHLLPFCLDIDLTRFCRINSSADRLGSSGKIQSTAENAAGDSGSVLHPSALELSSVPSLYEKGYGLSSTYCPCNGVLVDLTISCGHDCLGSLETLWHFYKKQLFFQLWPGSSLNNFIVPNTSGSSVRRSIILSRTDHGTGSQVLEVLLPVRLLSNGCAITGSSLNLCMPQFLTM